MVIIYLHDTLLIFKEAEIKRVYKLLFAFILSISTGMQLSTGYSYATQRRIHLGHLHSLFLIAIRQHLLEKNDITLEETDYLALTLESA